MYNISMSDTSRVLKKATFANGCFWCTEAIFKRLKGVVQVVSGYTGGTTENPTYEQVCRGDTGHAEALQITFDPDQISYPTLLDVFWATHNPTTLNRQGLDQGTQYRSAIFCHSQEQKQQAEASRDTLSKSGTYSVPIVTEIVPFEKFYEAEEYHADYYDKYRFQPYCQVVIDPKIKKLLEEFGDSIKEEYKKEH
jgi:peptide-methionine (S)-S-oxide reductase